MLPDALVVVPPKTGEVSVLLVRVWVPVSVATPVNVLLAALIVLLVRVCVAVSVTPPTCPAATSAVVARVPDTGKVIAVVAVVVIVVAWAPDVVKVEPSARVRVAVVAGGVRVTLFTDVALATPKTGVVKVGVFVKARTPVPDSSLIIPARSAELPTWRLVIDTLPLVVIAILCYLASERIE